MGTWLEPSLILSVWVIGGYVELNRMAGVYISLTEAQELS